MNFKNWKLVDIDNYMDGNSYFSTFKEESVWEAKVRKTIGPSATVWNSDKIQSPMFFSDILTPEIQKYLDRLETWDTASNRKMSSLHKQKEAF